MFGMRLLTAVALVTASFVAHAGTTVENIRIWSEGDKTRVVLDLSRPARHSIFTLRGPDRLVVDLKDGKLANSLGSLPTGTGLVRSIRSGVRANGQLRVVLDLNTEVRSRSFTAKPNSAYGDRLVIDLKRAGSPQTVKRASETYERGRDIVIAIDPGHGGKDPGAIGKARISRELARKIDAEPGMRAILIRDGDHYVDHRRRMQIARQNRADLFVSIHADAVDDRRPQGTTVYALSLKGASDEAARQLAARENATVGGVPLSDKDDVLASVLYDLSQNAALSASLDVGDDISRELARIGKVHRRKVQQAGLIVLKSPDMPYENPPPDTRIAMQARREPVRQVRHVITRGDTLSEIAQRYNVSTSELRRANRLSNDRIRIGQTLSIPVYGGG